MRPSFKSKFLPFVTTALLNLAGLSEAAGAAQVVEHHWTLSNQDIAPDGFVRTASLINGQYPGPLLALNKGDTAYVTVHNDLTNSSLLRSTSIHWHGIFEHRNAQNDGPSFVTQCPIAPQHSYKYFIAPGDQSGTYWYHSHLGTQYVDGIRGPLVIYDPDDPNKDLYDVDDASTVISLSDWYHDSALKIQRAWFAGGPEPVPDSGLINGAGRYANGPPVPRTRINVEQGKRYRLRIGSIAAAGVFNVSIQNHRMTVIEADGIAVHPYVVDFLPIFVAQRYSVVITADQPVDNYWFSARQTAIGSTTSPTNPNFNGSNVFAVLHYSGASSYEPTSSQIFASGPVQFNETGLIPIFHPGAPGGDTPPDYFFNLTFHTPSATEDIWFINGVQYQPPTLPTLLNILTHQNASFGINENTFTLPYNATVEIAFVGPAGHPFHLHGHAFSVIQSSSGGPPNYINPPRRDTALTSGSPAAPLRIRFRTDNPGPWFLHCHIDWHLEAGLAAVFAEDPAGIRSGPESVHPDQAWKELCDIYNKLPESEK